MTVISVIVLTGTAAVTVTTVTTVHQLLQRLSLPVFLYMPVLQQCMDSCSLSDGVYFTPFTGGHCLRLCITFLYYHCIVLTGVVWETVHNTMHFITAGIFSACSVVYDCNIPDIVLTGTASLMVSTMLLLEWQLSQPVFLYMTALSPHCFDRCSVCGVVHYALIFCLCI